MSYFRAWPFRVVPDRAPQVWADRKKVHLAYERLIDDVARRQRSVIAVVWGEFGAGKSHSLLNIRWKAQSQLGCQVVYSPLPKQMRQFSDLYRQGFAGALNFFEVAKAAAELWKRVNPSGIDDRMEMEAVEQVNKEISGGWTDFAQVISSLGRIVALTGSMTDPIALTAVAWLKGQRLSTRDLRILGASSNLTYDADFVRAAVAIVRMFVYHSKDPHPFFWLLDDCHFMAGMKPGQKGLALIQQGVRDVFDGCPTNFGLLMAFASKDSSHLDELLIGDIRSRTSHRIEIPILTPEESLEFIADLLGDPSVRVGDKSPSTYPFSKSALNRLVDLVSSKVDLTPREIMKALDQLVSAAERTLYPKQIDEAFVSDFMKDYSTGESEPT
jgi:hypothetical protein